MYFIAYMRGIQKMEQVVPSGEVGFVEGIQRMFAPCVLETLLCDRTTGKNILWTDGESEESDHSRRPYTEITIPQITGTNSGAIKPRRAKGSSEQSKRIKTHGEVFTPAWLVNQMNGTVDDDWFGRSQVFSVSDGWHWKSTQEPISFEGAPGTWMDYVDQRRLEITCGEAPFITTRYDMLTGERIPVRDRVGMLDRKLRIVREHTSTDEEWITWAMRALEATYGYEYQGDSLFIARSNVLLALSEALADAWGRELSDAEALRAATIISWNLWQMDGLRGTVPCPVLTDDTYSCEPLQTHEADRALFCLVYDWRADKCQEYRLLGMSE